MPLITYSEANFVLDNDKVSFASEADATPEATTADRIVRSKLYDLFPAHVTQWSSTGAPEATPELIKTITALIMGAFRYEKKYSEEVATAGRDAYSNILLQRAWDLIKGLKTGELTLTDVGYGTETGTEFSEDDFWPNATTGASQQYDVADRAVGGEHDQERIFWRAERF